MAMYTDNTAMDTPMMTETENRNPAPEYMTPSRVYMNTENGPRAALFPVYGLHVEDPELRKLTKKVITLSMLAVCLGTAYIITSLFISFYEHPRSRGSAVAVAALNVMFVMAIPLCGYFGARNNSKCLTACFCGWNCVNVVFYILGWASMMLLWYSLDELIDCLSDESATCELSDSFVKSFCVNVGISGMDMDNNQDKVECLDKVNELKHNLCVGFVLCSIFVIPNVILSFFSFKYGERLYCKLKQGVIVNGPVMVHTQESLVQPNWTAP